MRLLDKEKISRLPTVERKFSAVLSAFVAICAISALYMLGGVLWGDYREEGEFQQKAISAKGTVTGFKEDYPQVTFRAGNLDRTITVGYRPVPMSEQPSWKGTTVTVQYLPAEPRRTRVIDWYAPTPRTRQYVALALATVGMLIGAVFSTYYAWIAWPRAPNNLSHRTASGGG
jgi:hypothetical protein